MATHPRHPVLVGAHELSIRTADAEPIAMMVDASAAALVESGVDLAPRIQTVRVVKGIWPYVDPGRLVADRLELSEATTTAITGIGGNATYDLVNATASEIADGSLDGALICGAESMRTRRKDKAAGRRSPYLEEAPSAAPDLVVAGDAPMVDEFDSAARVDHPVNFYALVESAIRHREQESIEAHHERISKLWAGGSNVAATNPHAWIREPVSAAQIGAPGPTNRPVAAPYTKLMTSNINVDQGAAVVLCAYEVAEAAGVSPESMVFLVAGSGAADHLPVRRRWELDRSPAFALSAERALSLTQRPIDDIEHLDLYSCFPASVQLARAELGLGTDRAFTVTGGLTFAGGPFNGYCTQALAHTVALLRGTDESAFLYGNGGYFSKHSVLVLSAAAPTHPFAYERVQDAVDATPARPAVADAEQGTLEAYTVTYDRSGDPDGAILAVIDENGGRLWATSDDQVLIDALLLADQVGRLVLVEASDDTPLPKATLT